MKIAIFENEYHSVKYAFEAANTLKFNNALELVKFSKSQEFNIENIDEFKVFFIDIDLSIKSDMDGYTLILKLLNKDPNIVNKIVVLTGNNKIRSGLEEKGISPNDIKIILKPTNFQDISKAIKEIITS